MLEFLKRLLGVEPAPAVDPRAVLANALAELGASDLVPRALALYDDPEAFVSFALDCGGFVPWEGEERQPGAPELAFAVFLTLMMQNDRIGMIDWADGPQEIAEVFDSLLAKAGVDCLSPRERSELETLAEGGKRGDAFLRAMDWLASAMALRGLAVHYLDMGWDAHVPFLAAPEVLERWQSARFGKRQPVLP